ncbi:MAG TPA: PaaI family thioesterase [Noviherbaspirillum sp.]|uniref:PaaI family thioesterase n=1 Tax=Noviherbaspirillum sp. TaxID=1926288 RepID=UPI002B466EF6|nr:PaaI family thioesterase [Noviherbaspirillum sp.]HJV85199.1 PaaI family thioesterase [Noviherbaspirillum sp.]
MKNIDHMAPLAQRQGMPVEVPEGFERLNRGSPFVELVGPLYGKRIDGRNIVIGMRAGPQHANVKGLVHGGLMLTLADTALGIAITIANDEVPMVTVNLSTDFVESAHPGDWIEAHVDIQRIGARLAFANCYLMVDGRRILRASGVFAAKGKSRKA